MVLNIQWGKFISFLFFFFLKISPELTTASPPLFAEEAWPWANIVPIFLYFICGMPTTAWRAKRCHIRTRDLNQWTPGRWSGTWELNCCATCWLQYLPLKLKHTRTRMHTHTHTPTLARRMALSVTFKGFSGFSLCFSLSPGFLRSSPAEGWIYTWCQFVFIC